MAMAFVRRSVPLLIITMFVGGCNGGRIEELEIQVADMESQLEEIRSNLNDVESDLKTLKGRVNNLDRTISTFSYMDCRIAVIGVQSSTRDVITSVNTIESSIADVVHSAQ